VSNYNKYWTARENSKNAEIFTPSFLIREMLDKIPDEIWKSSETTFLDPCFGSGSFLKCIAEKLREFGHDDLNISKRIWGIDISRKWYNRVKHFRVGEYNIENIYCGDSLNTNILDNMKFDVVCGNPPFQDSSKVAKNSSLWMKFIPLCYSLCRDNGYLCMISPDTWIAPSETQKTEIKSIFSQRRTLEVNFNIKNYFPGIGSGFCYFIIENIGDTETETKIIGSDGSGFVINFKEDTFLPKFINKISLSIFNKILNNPKYKKSGFSSSMRSNGEGTENGKYKIYSKKEEMMNVDEPAPNAGIKKIVVSKISYLYPRYDNGIYGTGKNTYWKPINSEMEGENYIKFLNTFLVKTLIDKLFRYSGFNSLGVLKALPELDWTKKWTDEDLFIEFDLKDDEIHFLKKL